MSWQVAQVEFKLASPLSKPQPKRPHGVMSGIREAPFCWPSTPNLSWTESKYIMLYALVS